MQYAAPACQLPRPRTSDSRLISPRSGDVEVTEPTHDTHTPNAEFERASYYSAGQVALVRGADQEVACTASRRSGPRAWLHAVRWLFAAGHHGVNATTVRVAEDLGARMDYDTGHVRYCLKATAARLGVSEASLKRHVKRLREVGALAWAVHGSRTNVLRKVGLKGYAGTATVYAAVIPPAYDHAMGHTIVGSGYEARIIIDQRGQTPRNPVDNPPVEKGCEPPSLTVVTEESQVQMVGGFNYTPHAGREKRSLPHQSSSKDGQRRSADDVRQAMTVTRLVRALVNWTQRVPLRRLEFVLRPLTDRGLDSQQISDELHGMTQGWRPAKPAEFIQARLAAETDWQDRLDAQQAAEETAARPQDNAAWCEWRNLQQLIDDTPQRTDGDRRHAHLYGWSQWEEVAAHYADDPADAEDLYGKRLVRFAVGKQIDFEERNGSYV